MNRFASVTRPLMWFMAFMLAALTAGCGGGSGGGAPILGLPGVVAFTVTPVAATIPITGTQQFTAIETYSDGSSRNVTATATWTSGTLAVAANPIAGLATGLTTGTTLITATSGGRTATATLTVNAATSMSFKVTPTTATIPAGGTQQYMAIETFSDGTTIDRTTTTAAGTTVWSKTGGVGGICAEATVGTTTATGTGLATDFGVATGVTPTPLATPCLIHATFTPAGGAAILAIPATLIVNTAKSVSFVVTPVGPTISVGGVQKFVATETFSDGSSFDRTAASAWTAPDLDPVSGLPVATFSANGVGGGLATGNFVGTSRITATYTVGLVVKISPLSPLPGGALLTVTAIPPLPVVSIIVTPPAASILVGGTYQYTATATYSDGSSLDVTTNAGTGWISATPAKATFAVGPPTGIATGVAAGTSAITASFGGKFSPPLGAILTVTGAPPLVCGIPGAPPCLGLAGTYGIIASSKITISGALTTTSHIYGDVALTAATIAPLVGFTPYGNLAAVPQCWTSPQVTGSVNTSDNCVFTNGAPPQPYTDLHAAYLDLMGRVAPLVAPVFPNGVGGGTFAAATDLSGWILTPGVYDLPLADYGLSKTKGPLVLDAGGNPDAVFIIRSTSLGAGFSSTDGSVVLQGKAQAKNVFWVMPGAPVIGAAAGGTFFQGTVVAGAAATLGTFTIVQGRILAGANVAGAVTLSDTNTITVPQ